jgi:two-component system, cell cycle response regulator
MKPAKKNRPLFFLHTPDEVRHPYEMALSRISETVFWFTNFEDLSAATGEDPSVVIIDLDTLPKPLDVPLDLLRIHFPKSELIGLSSQDSAQTALKCLRSGFSDFLLKPLSPEELAWSIKKNQQKLEMVERIDDPRSKLVRTITQISSCTTPTLVRVCALEFLQHFFHAKGAAWVRWENGPMILSSIPRNVPDAEVAKLLSQSEKFMASKDLVLHNSKTAKYKIYFPCHHQPEGVLLWGIKKHPTAKDRPMGSNLLEHCEISLLNIQKLEELKQQTFVDDLTGLYNSRYLKFAINNAVLRSKNRGDNFTIFFIDVDYFKRVNDTHGHVVGSEFLVAIGKTIRNAVRGIDPVFRYGGDEFVVILHDANATAAWEIAERLRKNIERRVYVIKGERLQATVSIGLAAFPEHASDPEMILKMADEAMYSAKQTSRNAVHLALPPSDSLTKKVSDSRNR